MGDNDPRQTKSIDSIIYQTLIGDIKMACRFVQKQNAGLTVKRPGKNKPLLLPAGQCASHVAYQAVIAHGHAHYIVMDRRQPRRVLHTLLFGSSLKEGYVLCNAAGEKLVILHYRADGFTQAPSASAAQRLSTNADTSLRRLKKTEHKLHERCLAAS